MKISTFNAIEAIQAHHPNFSSLRHCQTHSVSFILNDIPTNAELFLYTDDEENFPYLYIDNDIYPDTLFPLNDIKFHNFMLSKYLDETLALTTRDLL